MTNTQYDNVIVTAPIDYELATLIKFVIITEVCVNNRKCQDKNEVTLIINVTDLDETPKVNRNVELKELE